MSSEVKLLVFSIVVMLGLGLILGLVLGFFQSFQVVVDNRIEEVTKRLGINWLRFSWLFGFGHCHCQ